MASSSRSNTGRNYQYSEKNSYQREIEMDERTSRKVPSYRKRLNKFDQLVNRMSDDQVEDELKRRNLSTSGSNQILRTRLHNHERSALISHCADLLAANEQQFRYIVVIDFEATCDFKAPVTYPHEIIEFPLVLIDTQQQKIIDQFQSYCRPVQNPILSDFCKKLTGISQEQVDSAPVFPDVFRNVQQWLNERNLLTPLNADRVAFATDSPSDFSRFFRFQCHISGIPYPEAMKQWIDIHKAFAGFYSTSSCGLTRMLKHLGVKFQGQHHSGLDDATNIARVAITMIKDGCNLGLNDNLHNNDWRFLTMIGQNVAAVPEDDQEDEDDDGIVFQDETDN